MLIAKQQIGAHAAPYIIAELGVNHDGSVDRALELTHAAADAQADAIKLQLFKTDALMSRAAKLAAYQKAAGETDPISMLRRLELSIDQMATIVDAAHKLGLHTIVTVFSVELVPIAERLPWDAYKSASPDLVNRPLLEALAQTGKPLIVSTGASTLREVGRSLNWLRAIADRVALLQCVSCYPTPIEHNGILGMRALSEIFPGPVGYSDHTDDERTGSAAVTMGAAIIEKHLTYDRSAKGPDHAASLDPAGFARYVQMCHDAWTVGRSQKPVMEKIKNAKGRGSKRLLAEAQESFGAMSRLTDTTDDSIHATKEVLPIENDVRLVSRQSIVPRRDLPAGHRLVRDDLTIKRPGTGIPASDLTDIIGRILARPVEADMPLVREDLAA